MVEVYFEREVLPHAPDAWIDHEKTKVGYEIPFNRHFYVFKTATGTCGNRRRSQGRYRPYPDDDCGVECMSTKLALKHSEFSEVLGIIRTGRAKAYEAVNVALIETYCGSWRTSCRTR